MDKINKNYILAFAAVILVVLVGVIAYVIASAGNAPASGTAQFTQLNLNTGNTTNTSNTQTESSTTWEFDGSKWQSKGSVPSCASTLESPVDMSLVTNVLYPGQIRGGNYKAHGGFIFAGAKSTDITVTAPLTAKLVKASRYIEQGEVQYLLVFISPCGIMYRLDHLANLSAALSPILIELPQPTESSVTTNLDKPIEVKVGDTISTAVGFARSGNTSMDFGVYDLRKVNTISSNTAWATTNAAYKETSYYGICWLDMFTGEDLTRVKSLPSTSTEGKISDYCSQ